MLKDRLNRKNGQESKFTIKQSRFRRQFVKKKKSKFKLSNSKQPVQQKIIKIAEFSINN